MTNTYHAEVERKNRIENIVEKIGMGQIVKQKYCRKAGAAKGSWLCISDTGITTIKDDAGELVITVYVTTSRELLFAYDGNAKKIPPYLRKRVARNESAYIREGKTIWQ